MNEVQSAIRNLSSNIDNFIEKNEKEINEIKAKIMKQTTQLPLSNNMSNTTHQKAEFSEYIRKGISTFFKKSLNEEKDKDGGYLIPQEIAVKINQKVMLLSPMRSISKIMRISTNSVDMMIESKQSDAGWAGNMEDRPETDSPEIKKIKIPAHELYAKPKACQKLLDDAQINVEDWLINRMAEKIAILENKAFITGDGQDKPTGFLNYESSNDEVREGENFGKLQHFSTGVDGKFENDASAVNILIDMMCSIKPIYAKNAKWIMSRSALAEIRKLKNNDGVNLWQPSLSEDIPQTLLGYPVILDDDMPALKDGTKSTSIAFGDFQAGYQIVDRQELTILRDPYTSKPFVEFYAAKRIGGAVIDFDAIKLLKFERSQ